MGRTKDGFDFHVEKQARVCPVPVVFNNLMDSFDSLAIERALKRAVESSNTPVKALLLTNPHNPLGRCYSEDNLLTFARFCGHHDIHLISDEVYALSTFTALSDSNSFVSALSIDLDRADCDRSKIHVVWSTSKDLGCSGLRLVSSSSLKPLVDSNSDFFQIKASVVSQDNTNLIQTISVTGCLQISNLATLSARCILTASALPDILSRNRDKLAECYRIMTTFLNSRQIEYIPATAGLYVFARLLHSEMDDEAQQAQILQDSGILVGTGQSYHTPGKGWFRLVFSIGSPHLLQEALGRLGTVLDSTSTKKDSKPRSLVKKEKEKEKKEQKQKEEKPLVKRRRVLLSRRGPRKLHVQRETKRRENRTNS